MRRALCSWFLRVLEGWVGGQPEHQPSLHMGAGLSMRLLPLRAGGSPFPYPGFGHRLRGMAPAEPEEAPARLHLLFHPQDGGLVPWPSDGQSLVQSPPSSPGAQPKSTSTHACCLDLLSLGCYFMASIHPGYSDTTPRTKQLIVHCSELCRREALADPRSDGPLSGPQMVPSCHAPPGRRGVSLGAPSLGHQSLQSERSC